LENNDNIKVPDDINEETMEINQIEQIYCLDKLDVCFKGNIIEPNLVLKRIQTKMKSIILF
jgi:hypothetical protein